MYATPEGVNRRGRPMCLPYYCSVGADRCVCPISTAPCHPEPCVRDLGSLLYSSAVLNLYAFIVYSFCSLSSSFFHRVKEPKRPAHGLSKSLPFFARATACEHSVERRLPLVSAVPTSGTKELASRIPSIVWHTRSNTFVLIPLLELTRAVAQTVPVFFLTLPFAGGLHQCRGWVCQP